MRKLPRRRRDRPGCCPSGSWLDSLRLDAPITAVLSRTGQIFLHALTPHTEPVSHLLHRKSGHAMQHQCRSHPGRKLREEALELLYPLSVIRLGHWVVTLRGGELGCRLRDVDECGIGEAPKCVLMDHVACHGEQVSLRISDRLVLI